MNQVYQVAKQDLAAAKAAFDGGDFQQMNLYSNRLMANVLFGDQKLYAISGFFMKNLAVEFLGVGLDSTLGRELHPMAKDFIVNISESFKPDVNVGSVWKGYFEYNEKKRKLYMTPYERRAYVDNRDFTRLALSYLAQELLTGEALFHERGLVPKAFLTEADRLIRNHGAETKDLVLLSLITALDGLNDFIRVECSSATGGTNPDCLKSRLSPFLGRIGKWIEQSEDFPYPDASNILSDVILESRKYFLRYMELGRVAKTEERRVELPAEAKKRISDTVAQALQKDLEENPTKRKKQR